MRSIPTFQVPDIGDDVSDQFLLLNKTLESVTVPVIAIAASGKIVAVNTIFANLFSTVAATLIDKKRNNVTDFRSLKPFEGEGTAGLPAPKYQLQLSILNSKAVILGITIQRIWVAGHRIAVFSCQPLKELFAKRREVKQLHENLELKVRMRTVALANRVRELDQAKARLTTTLKTLQSAQASLMNAEKMAALGRLVAGVAHEVNTPLGIGVTASSHLAEELKALSKSYADHSITNEQMTQFLNSSDEAVQIIVNNLVRAANLIRSFKKVAVDQNDEMARSINMKNYVEDVLLSLRPQIKCTSHTVQFDCDPDLELKTYPGILAQLLTNLITNSLTHAFSDEEAGEMNIKISLENNNEVYLKYLDTGRGIPEDMIEKVFEPFVTSKRGQGGTGLGLNIVHNLVTQKLGGSVKCSNTAGQGACFELRWPQDVAPDGAIDTTE